MSGERRGVGRVLAGVFTSCLLLGSAGAGGAGLGCSAEASSDAEPDESELTEEQALLSPAPVQGAVPSGRPAKHAIVLAHGFMGTDSASPSFTNVWAFHRAADALRRDGHLVVEGRVQPFNSPEVRAKELVKHVDAALEQCRTTAGCDPRRVNLVAHSMGGLDCRVLISQLGYGDRVASLTTVSTPHRGSHIADVGLNVLDATKSDDALNKLFKAFGMTFTSADLARNSNIRAALTALAESSSESFNARNRDDARVYYQSWAGVSNVGGVRNWKDYPACGDRLETYRYRRDVMDPLLVPVAAIVAHGGSLIPNDGMATVDSAKYGNFRGCIPADHFDEVGQIKDDTYDRRTGFDHVRFYRNVAFDLARRGY